MQTLGKGTGYEDITVYFLIPKKYMQGAEIYNGGIILLSDKCDYALDPLISNETINYPIGNYKRLKIFHKNMDFGVAKAKISTYRFYDGDGKQRFFVASVDNLIPSTTQPPFTEKKFYELRR